MQWILLGTWLGQGVLLAIMLAANPLHFGFAPALSTAVWLAGALYGLERRKHPKLSLHWAQAALIVLVMVLAWYFPGPAMPDHLPWWLPLHGALGLASYSLFAVALWHAWLYHQQEKIMRTPTLQRRREASVSLPLLALERLMFRFVLAGFVLLSVTLAVGFLHSEYMDKASLSGWWSHKTVFACLSWGVFALLLVGHLRWGWRGRKAVRVLVAGAILLLLSYAGSRFVWEIVLGRS